MKCGYFIRTVDFIYNDAKPTTGTERISCIEITWRHDLFMSKYREHSDFIKLNLSGGGTEAGDVLLK